MLAVPQRLKLKTFHPEVLDDERACAWMTKPSLAMRPCGRTEHRVLASASGPSVTPCMMYSDSSTCGAVCCTVRPIFGPGCQTLVCLDSAFRLQPKLCI